MQFKLHSKQPVIAMMALMGLALSVAADDHQATRTGLNGYCPVCILDARKWEKGRSDISADFDGYRYYFPNTAIREKFRRNPAAYVPVLNGDCIVCLKKAGKRVPGAVTHASIYRN